MKYLWIIEAYRLRRCEEELYTYAVQAETEEEALQLAKDEPKQNTGWGYEIVKKIEIGGKPVQEISWEYFDK